MNTKKNLLREKRIIAITGSRYSASTAMGAMLGSTKNGQDIFHVGEYGLCCNDFEKQSLEQRLTFSAEGMEDEHHEYQKIWRNILSESCRKDPYEAIFEQQNTQVIIDSSKKPKWFIERLKFGWEIRFIICWQDIYQLAYSLKKRHFSGEKLIERLEICIEKLVTSLQFIREFDAKFITVRGRDFITNPALMSEKICQFADIEYFPGKENYWEFDHHHLRGNKRQRRQIEKKQEMGYKIEEFDQDFDPTPIFALAYKYNEVFLDLASTRNIRSTQE